MKRSSLHALLPALALLSSTSAWAATTVDAGSVSVQNQSIKLQSNMPTLVRSLDGEIQLRIDYDLSDARTGRNYFTRVKAVLLRQNHYGDWETVWAEDAKAGARLRAANRLHRESGKLLSPAIHQPADETRYRLELSGYSNLHARSESVEFTVRRENAS
ncbi:MAG: hypothetical protein KDH88_02250 [Chromatiales bacterium]|nr:hypothetical protein [Chromatiales bacterium]